MSLDILKERFSGKPITSEYEEKLENKENIIQNLNEKTIILSDEVNKLKNEKNTLIQQLNEAKHFEDGVFSIKEKEYDEKIYLKDTTIKVMREEVNSLHLKLDKKDERLSYKDDLINNSLNIIKEAKNKINYLNGKLKLSKNSKKELKLEIKKTYQDYIFKIDNLENNIKDRNDIINEQKHILKEDNKKIKKLTNKLENLKIKSNKDKEKINELNNELKESKTTLVLENNAFKQRLNEKEKNISKLETKIENLSEKVIGLSETAQEKSILEKKLKEAEKFQNIVKNKDYKINVTNNNNLNTDNLIYKLKEVSKEKQGPKPLTWKQWIEIPESNYLNELNHDIAKKIFNEVNQQFLLEDRNQYDGHTRRPAMAYGQSLIEELRQNYLIKLYSAQISNDIDDPYYNVVSASHDGSEMKVTNIVSNGGIKEYQNNAFTLVGHSGSISEYGKISTAKQTPEPKTDEDGVHYLLHWDNEDNDTAPTDVGGIFFHSTQKYDFGIGEGGGPAVHSPGDTDALREGYDPFTTDKEMTMVFTWLYPSVHEGDGRTNVGKTGSSLYYANYVIRRTKDDEGNSINMRYNIRLQQASGSSNYLHMRNDFNSLANDGQAKTEIFTENPIVPDKKFVLFARVNRKNGTISLALNKDYPTPTAIADNNVSYTRNSNTENNAGVLSTISLRSARAGVPEFRNYDFRIYEKDLTYEEQVAVWDELSELYKVEE